MSTDKKPRMEPITSPKGTAKFPHLTIPDTKFKAGGEYHINVICSRASALKHIEKLEAAAKKAFADAVAELNATIASSTGEKKAKAKKSLEALKQGDLPVRPLYDDEGNETDQVEMVFKCNATYKDKAGDEKEIKPKLFAADGSDFPKGIDIWSGSVVRASGLINPYYIPGTNMAGVSLRLSAVQVIKVNNGSSGGDSSRYGFEPEEGDDPADFAPSGDTHSGGDAAATGDGTEF